MSAPLSESAIWETEGAAKRAAVRSMFAQIAPTYDRLNGVMSFNLHGRWRTYAVSKLALKPGDKVLDVCCGTGDFFRPLRTAVGESGTVAGVDFCLPMLQQTPGKDGALPAISLGDACNLPIASDSVNGLTVGWGIRNVPDVDRAHREAWRVLKSGGRFVSLDMARPRNALLRVVSEMVFQYGVPLLGRLFGQAEAYTYLPKSTQRFRTREELKASMESAGFVNVEYRDLMFGNVCLHWGRKL